MFPLVNTTESAGGEGGIEVVRAPACGGRLMQTNVRRSDRTRARRAAFLIGAILVVGVFACLPASAQLLPPVPPLPLPTSSTGIDLNKTVDDVTGLVNDVPDQLGSIVDDTTASLTLPTGGGG